MIFKERKKHLPGKVIAFEQTVDLGKRNSVSRALEVDKQDAATLYGFIDSVVDEEEQKPSESRQIYGALVHLDQVFKFTGGEVSHAFNKRMTKIAENLNLEISQS